VADLSDRIGRHLCAPAVHRFRKAVQQQDQRRTALAGNEGVERQPRYGGDFFDFWLEAILVRGA
jgi:hypothetical protein